MLVIELPESISTWIDRSEACVAYNINFIHFVFPFGWNAQQTFFFEVATKIEPIIIQLDKCLVFSIIFVRDFNNCLIARFCSKLQWIENRAVFHPNYFLPHKTHIETRLEYWRILFGELISTILEFGCVVLCTHLSFWKVCLWPVAPFQNVCSVHCF